MMVNKHFYHQTIPTPKFFTTTTQRIKLSEIQSLLTNTCIRLKLFCQNMHICCSSIPNFKIVVMLEHLIFVELGETRILILSNTKLNNELWVVHELNRTTVITCHCPFSIAKLLPHIAKSFITIFIFN